MIHISFNSVIIIFNKIDNLVLNSPFKKVELPNSGFHSFFVVAFFLLLNIALALGKGERIPPAVAAWLPNAVFAGVGAVLLWRNR